MRRIAVWSGGALLVLLLVLSHSAASLVALPENAHSLRTTQADDTIAVSSGNITPDKVNMENLEEFKRQFMRQFPFGTPKQEVESYFKRWGMRYEYFEYKDRRTLLSVIDDMGTIMLVIKPSLALRIPLDMEGRVKEVMFRVDYW